METDEYTVRIREAPDTYDRRKQECVVDATSPCQAAIIAPGLASCPGLVYEVETPERCVPVTDGDLVLYLASRIEEKEADPLGFVGTFTSFAARSDDVSYQIATALCEKYDDAWVQYGEAYYLLAVDEQFESLRALADALRTLKYRDFQHRYAAELTIYGVFNLQMDQDFAELSVLNRDPFDVVRLVTENTHDPSQRQSHTFSFDDVVAADWLGVDAGEVLVELTVQTDGLLLVPNGRQEVARFAKDMVRDEIDGQEFKMQVERVLVDSLSVQSYTAEGDEDL